jgi:hypothetical protein
LTVREIERRANCCRTIVHRALREAVRVGHIKVTYRKVAIRWNLPNVITIVSRRWVAWLRLAPSRPRPWGCAQQPNKETWTRVHECVPEPHTIQVREDVRTKPPHGLRPGRHY